MESPELLMIDKDAAQLRGACTACARLFHAFIRNTEEEAMRLLNRSFNVHCRLRHRIVVQPPFADSGVEGMFQDLALPAYVFERSTRKVIAANLHFKQLMGYTEGIGDLKLDDLRAPEDLPAMHRNLRQFTGKGMVDRRLRTKEGRTLQVRCTYQDISLPGKDATVPDACFVVVLTAVSAA
jgi:PAS domain-containing protein